MIWRNLKHNLSSWGTLVQLSCFHRTCHLISSLLHFYVHSDNFPLRAYLKGTIQYWGFLSFGAGTVSFTIFTGLAIHSHITNNYKPVEKECNLSVQDRHKAVQLNRICKCFVKWEKKKIFQSSHLTSSFKLKWYFKCSYSSLNAFLDIIFMPAAIFNTSGITTKNV